MNKESVSVKFSAYNFLRLYCSIISIKDGNPVIDNHKLEKAIFKYYDVNDFEILFEDIIKKEDKIIPTESYLDLSKAFQTSYALGLLNILQNNATLKSTINITKNEARKIIEEFNLEYIAKMTNLAYKINLNIKNNEIEELSNFQKEVNQLNAPYKITEAYEIFSNNKRKNSISTFWDAEAGFVDKYKDVNMNLKNNNLTLFEEIELKKIREKVSNFDLLPLKRQQELFDEIVLGKKKEDKSLKLVKDNKGDNKYC